jgi:hypothetical protein
LESNKITQVPSDNSNEYKKLLKDSTTVLKRLSHIMSQSAVTTPWVDLLIQIINFTSSQGMSPAILAAMNLIEIISEYCPSDVSSNIDTLRNFLSLYFSIDSNSSIGLAIQVSCAKATGACIICIEDDHVRDTFKPALNPIITILGIVLTRSEGDSEQDATSIMEHLCTIGIFF